MAGICIDSSVVRVRRLGFKELFRLSIRLARLVYGFGISVLNDE